MDIFKINISDKFNVDLSVTFLTFQSRSRLNCLVFKINISDNFDVDLFVTFLTFQSRSMLNCLVSVINVHEYLALLLMHKQG